MSITESVVAQVSSHGAGQVRVRSVHTGSDGKEYTLRRKAPEGEDHDARLPEYAAEMFRHMQRGEVESFYKHLCKGFAHADFTRHHATPQQMRRGILKRFVFEDHSLKAARLAVWIETLTDQQILDSGLNAGKRANIRARQANLVPIVAALALDRTYIYGQN